ncbi:MAG: hypothetical protein R3E48_00350 [Burkholderiaceae bacterium]
MRWQIDVNKLDLEDALQGRAVLRDAEAAVPSGPSPVLRATKLEAQVRWAAIGYNLLKAHRKLERLQAVAV